MGGGAYYIPYPKATLVKLSGALRPMVSAKDVILEVLRVMSVKGGVGKIVEYGGEGVKNLTVPQRATITNMGAGAGRDNLHFSKRRSHPCLSEGAGARRGLYAAGRRRGRRVRRGH